MNLTKHLAFIGSKLANVSNYRRYAEELPSFLRGIRRAQTFWGDTMYVPFPEHRCVVERGHMDGEEELEMYLLEHLSPKDVFFDIGANAGFFSLLAKHKGAIVHAFEPFPSTYQLLAKNVALNGGGVHTYDLAVSSATGSLLMEGKPYSGYNQVSDNGTVPVSTVALDDFTVVPTVIKMDVEGHDLEAVKGMEKMLKRHMPILLVECDTSMDFLLGLGYKATLLGTGPRALQKRNYIFEPRKSKTVPVEEPESSSH